MRPMSFCFHLPRAGAAACNVVVAAALAVVTGSASATPRCEGKLLRTQISERQEVSVTMLRAKRFDELQARMDGFLAAYVGGALTDEELFYEFGAFDRSESRLTPILDEWLVRSPKSYAAHHAMALHQSAIAWQSRGSALARDTSRQQMEEFERRLAIARDWNVRAIKLAAKPVLSYQQLVTNAKAQRVNAKLLKSLGLKPVRDIPGELDPRPDVRSLVTAGLVVDPDSTVLRNAYITVLSPRWGGSLAALEQYGKRESHPRLADDRFAAVAYTALMEIGADFEFRKEPDLAVPYYQQASRLCRQNAPWVNIARIRVEQKRYHEALAAADAAVTLVPDGFQASRYRAYALSGVGRHVEAVELLQRLLPEGSPDVAYFLGEYYLRGEGGLKSDAAEARRLFGVAARGGDERAIRRLTAMSSPR